MWMLRRQLAKNENKRRGRKARAATVQSNKYSSMYLFDAFSLSFVSWETSKSSWYRFLADFYLLRNECLMSESGQKPCIVHIDEKIKIDTTSTIFGGGIHFKLTALIYSTTSFLLFITELLISNKINKQSARFNALSTHLSQINKLPEPKNMRLVRFSCVGGITYLLRSHSTTMQRH